MNTFNNYQEWHYAITKVGGFELTKEYCEQRIAELEDENNPHTKAFIAAYGVAYLTQVIDWFKLAHAA